MANIGTLSARTSLSSEGFSAGADRVIAKAKATESTLGSIFSKINVGFSSGIGGGVFGNLGDVLSVAGSLNKVALGAGLAVGGYFALETAVKKYAAAGMEAIKLNDRMAQQLGISQASAVALTTIGGGNHEAVTSASQQALRHIGELRQDIATGGSGGGAGSALRALGINAEEFARMPDWTAQLGLLGDRLRGVASGADRANFARAILGRGFQELMPQLRMGSEGLARMTQLAEHFGVTVAGEARDSVLGAAKAAKEFKLVQSLATQGLQNQFAAGFQMGSNSAANYEEATRRLIALQPQLADAYRRAGEVAGSVMGGVESVWVKFLANIHIALERLQGLSPRLNAPAPTSGPGGIPIDSAESQLANLRANQPLNQSDLVAATGEFNAARLAYTHAIRDGVEGDQLREYRLAFEEAERNLRDANFRLTDGAARILALQEQINDGWAPATGEEFAAMEDSIVSGLITDIGGVESAWHRQQRTIGLTREEIMRMDAAAQGANAAQLAGLDSIIARQQEERRIIEAKEAAQRTRSLAMEARSPIESFRDRLREIDKIASSLSLEQRGSLLLRAAQNAGYSRQPTQLLGSLSADSAETGAIMQQQGTQEIDLLTDIRAFLEAQRTATTESNRVLREIGESLTSLMEAVDS